ncbi:MAG: tagaturonate reductase, partial [Clostridiales bacterium]|nr:tagaturonate reductase [Clostridiales bacterium]
PCELIDDNGAELKRVLTGLAESRGMGADFIEWLTKANRFVGTLVDRIVPGYPRGEIAEIQAETGYEDRNVVEGEIFHLWVLESDDRAQSRFPADKCGLNVLFVKDIKPYKERKVKILNGAHTALVPVAYLAGFDTVREAIEDPKIGGFVKKLIFEEISPTIDLPEEQKKAFAESVIERFLNPFIRHELMSIALNSTAKFRTRLLPSLTDYVRLYKKLPVNLCCAFAAFILFHRGKRGNGEAIALNDEPQYLARWKRAWDNFTDCESLAREVCGWKDIWGMDLAEIHADFTDAVAADLKKLMGAEA